MHYPNSNPYFFGRISILKHCSGNNFTFNPIILVANSKRYFVCPSVGSSVGPAVGPSVCGSICPWVRWFSKTANSTKFKRIQVNSTKFNKIHDFSQLLAEWLPCLSVFFTETEMRTVIQRSKRFPFQERKTEHRFVTDPFCRSLVVSDKWSVVSFRC